MQALHLSKSVTSALAILLAVLDRRSTGNRPLRTIEGSPNTPPLRTSLNYPSTPTIPTRSEGAIYDGQNKPSVPDCRGTTAGAPQQNAGRRGRKPDVRFALRSCRFARCRPAAGRAYSMVAAIFLAPLGVVMLTSMREWGRTRRAVTAADQDGLAGHCR